jgi:hypothetical protein
MSPRLDTDQDYAEHLDNFMYREEDFKPTLSRHLLGLMASALSGFIVGLIIGATAMAAFEAIV